MATLLDVVVILLIAGLLVLGGIGMYQSFVLHELGREEKKGEWWIFMLLGDLFDPNMSDAFKARRRRVIAWWTAFLALWLTLVILISSVPPSTMQGGPR